MKYYYRLEIMINSNIDKELISDILNEVPTKFSDGRWELELIEHEKDDPVNFIDYFLDLLENKYDKLKEIGIESENITIWMLYEYDQQCNMEFRPHEMKRLGENGISLCISCWESGESQ